MARRNRTDQFLKYREAFRAHALPSSSKSHEMQELKGKAKLLQSGTTPRNTARGSVRDSSTVCSCSGITRWSKMASLAPRVYSSLASVKPAYASLVSAVVCADGDEEQGHLSLMLAQVRVRSLVRSTPRASVGRQRLATNRHLSPHPFSDPAPKLPAACAAGSARLAQI
jgi:hypothetical protein